jgi:hypothetical protein
MNVTIELPDEQVMALKSQLAARGLTVESWLREIAEQHLQSGSFAHLQRTNPEEWARRFRAWAESHDPNTPVLNDDDMSRESIYPDRI